MRKLVVFLVLLAVVLAIVDRVAVAGVQREIARQIEAKYDLDSAPTVEIKGIPFLTQAIGGRYDEIVVRIGPVSRNGVRLSSIDATLYGVSAPLADLVTDVSRADLRAERVTGTVVVSEQTLQARAPRGLDVEADGGETIRLSGKIGILGRDVTVTADMKLEIAQGAIRLTPTDVKLGGGVTVPNPERFVSFTVPVKNLPLNLKITSVRSTAQGLSIEGTATDVPLR
jgi:hypothetical protein